MTKKKQYKGKSTNTFFLILLIGMFVYFVINAFDNGSDLMWIGVFASFVGSVIAFFNRSRGSQFFRGVTIGFLIGSFVLVGIMLIANA